MGVELCEEFSHRQCVTILNVRIVGASLSLAGCAFILASIWLFRKYTNFAQRLVMWLTIAAMLDSIPYFFGTQHPKDGPFCDFQAFWVSLFEWVVLLWICALTFYMHAIVLWEWDSVTHERRYHVVVWGVAIVPAVIPLVANGYAPAGAWCWIDESQVALRFVLWYVPMLLLLAIIGVSYFLMYRRLWKRKAVARGVGVGEEEYAAMLDNMRTLRWYPVVYVIVSLFSVINRIQNAVHPGHPVFALYLLQSLSTPLQGFFNAGVYVTSVASISSSTCRDVKQALSRRFAGSEMQEYTVTATPPKTQQRSRAGRGGSSGNHGTADSSGLLDGVDTTSDSDADLLP